MSFRSYQMSDHCKKVYNPIRYFMENDLESIKASPLPSTRPSVPVNVSYGDPCAYEDFKPNPQILKRMSEMVGIADGYPDFRGSLEARNYLKNHYNEKLHFKVTENDIFVTSGCSLALWLALNVLAEVGDNVITPKPGFPLSNAIGKSQDIEIRHYNLKPEEGWEADLASLEKQIDSKTKAILINNPGNPTGQVFSEKHILEILSIAEKYKVPIIADEVYEGMTFSDVKFTSFGELTTNVPIFICGGMSKKFFAPGWRTGWLVLSGPKGVFEEVRKGIEGLTSILTNSNTICMEYLTRYDEQLAEDILRERMDKMRGRMEVLENGLQNCEAYRVLRAQGAMYGVILVKVELFEGINNTLDFCRKIFRDLNVVCFPGELFDGENFVRVVSCSDEKRMEEMSRRLLQFYEENKKRT